VKECCEPDPPRRKRRYWLLGLVLALLAFELIRVVNHRFFLIEWMAARNDVYGIRSALEEFADAHSKQYPADLRPLITPDDAGKCWLEGYNGHIPKDPWKHEYQYEPPTPAHPKPHVWSYGADGKRGGSGDDADIDSESIQESG
jgi:general secretion pathway protein G